jgi:hypothetical protein
VLSDAGMGRTSLAIAPSNQQVVYALAASNVPGPGGIYEQALHAVFRSSSGGAPGSWTARLRNSSSDTLSTYLLHNPLTCVYALCGYASRNSPYAMGWYVNVIAVDPVNPDIVWSAGVDLFRSDNGGTSWGVASYWWAGGATSFTHADQHNIVFHPGFNGTTNQTFFIANDGGVYSALNARATVGRTLSSLCTPASSGLRFSALNNGLGVTQFYHGAPFRNGQAFLGGTQDNGTVMGDTTHGPDGWSWILGGDGGFVAVDPRNPNTLYAESQNFNFAKSTDGGQNFYDAQDGITDPATSFIFVTPFVMDPQDPDRLWTGGTRMWRSNDGANYWSAASAPLAAGHTVSALAVAPNDAKRVVAGSNQGTIFRCSNALAAGLTTAWESSTPRAGFVTSLAFDPQSTTGVWATYGGFGGNHVFHSTDGGKTWTPRDGSGDGALPDIPVHSILVDPVGWNRLFLGPDLGVFVSTDGGETWAVENTGFATAVTESLSLLRTTDGDTYLFAFTHGRGAWRVKVPAAEPPRIVRRRLR